MIPWEEPIPECKDCMFYEYWLIDSPCRDCYFAFSENKTNYFRQKED